MREVRQVEEGKEGEGKQGRVMKGEGRFRLLYRRDVE